MVGGEAMHIWPFRKRPQEVDFESQRELAEMENSTREVRVKVDQFTALLTELQEKKRGQNDR